MARTEQPGRPRPPEPRGGPNAQQLPGLVAALSSVVRAQDATTPAATDYVVFVNAADGTLHVATAAALVAAGGGGGGGGGISDGDKGDITVASAGTVWTIDAGVVTSTKMGGDITAAGKSMVTAANAGAQRTLLGTDTSSDTRNAHGIVETGGPTVLAMGAVANGECLRRSGSTLVGAAVNALATTDLSSPQTGTIVFWNGTEWSLVAAGPTTPGAILYWNGSKWAVLEGDTPGVLTSDGAGTLSWIGL